MNETVRADHLRTRVAQDIELMVHNTVPDNERVFAVINADSNNPCIEGIEFFGMPRELAQLARAVRSPVPPIENQEHASATQ